MTDLLIKRLRGQRLDGRSPADCMVDAADEIESLRSRLADIEAQNRVMWDVANDREARLAEAERQRDGLIRIIRGVHGTLLDDRIAAVVRTPDSAPAAQHIKDNCGSCAKEGWVFGPYGERVGCPECEADQAPDAQEGT